MGENTVKFISKLVLLTMLPTAIFANNDVQNKAVIITKSLINKISKIKRNTSNASDVEAMLGKPSACFPLPGSQESWGCQWKGNLKSVAILGTLNIYFEAGTMTAITAIDASGNFLTP